MSLRWIVILSVGSSRQYIISTAYISISTNTMPIGRFHTLRRCNIWNSFELKMVCNMFDIKFQINFPNIELWLWDVLCNTENNVNRIHALQLILRYYSRRIMTNWNCFTLSAHNFIAGEQWGLIHHVQVYNDICENYFSKLDVTLWYSEWLAMNKNGGFLCHELHLWTILLIFYFQKCHSRSFSYHIELN